MNARYPVVAQRADHRCEYCRAPEVVFNSRFEVEHIFPQGSNEEDNLALACRSCNVYKSDYLTGYDEITQSDCRLFNPRADLWSDHFEIDTRNRMIEGLTSVGRATIMRLRMNRDAQVEARLQWMIIGIFP